MNGGHVVLDTTGMVYDRLAAYYEDVCEKVTGCLSENFFSFFFLSLSKKRSAA